MKALVRERMDDWVVRIGRALRKRYALIYSDDVTSELHLSVVL